MKCVDVIIPTYKPDQKFFQLLHRLDRQSLPPQKIIVINTGKEFFDEEAVDALHLQTPVEIHHIEVDEFDHGQTRNQAVKYSHAPYFICMTQDALPANQKLIEHLLAPMDEEVKLVYACQVPNQDAGHIERYTRQYNYPKKSQRRQKRYMESKIILPPMSVPPMREKVLWRLAGLCQRPFSMRICSMQPP